MAIGRLWDCRIAIGRLMVGFETLLRRWGAEPIPNCPGRFVLRGAPASLPPDVLLGPESTVTHHRVPGARDAVLVARFGDGGLISYHRPNGSYLHTLNTPEGFARKLAQLGIELTPRAQRPDDVSRDASPERRY
jgi:hypothetical protein